MDNIVYREEKNIELQSILHLYNDAGWTAYSNNPEKLFNSIKNSTYVLTAWDKTNLVGLLRIVGDGLSIIYIQDLLVLKSYRKRKIGTHLVKTAIQKYSLVRQKVLLTEDDPGTRAFYESLGFKSCDQGKLVAFAKIENEAGVK